MNLGTAVGSSVGRKILNSLTGLFFVGFVIGHLTGNFLLFAGPAAFNNYAALLTGMFHGVGLLVVEAVMLLFLAVHAWSGISVWRSKWAARTQKYAVSGNAGGKSAKSAASQSMLYTGLLLLVFIAFHVAQFKFGVTDARHPEDQLVNVAGEPIRNVYGLVIDSFEQPIWAFGYIVIMLFLGSHLWHGAWSALQSLGLAKDTTLPTLRLASHVVAVLLAIGFIALPGVIFAGNSYFQRLDDEYVQRHAAPTAQAPAMAPGWGE